MLLCHPNAHGGRVLDSNATWNDSNVLVCLEMYNSFPGAGSQYVRSLFPDNVPDGGKSGVGDGLWVLAFGGGDSRRMSPSAL